MQKLSVHVATHVGAFFCHQEPPDVFAWGASSTSGRLISLSSQRGYSALNIKNLKMVPKGPCLTTQCSLSHVLFVYEVTKPTLEMMATIRIVTGSEVGMYVCVCGVCVCVHVCSSYLSNLSINI